VTISQRGETGALRLPIGWPVPVRLSSERPVGEGFVRATITVPALAERFSEVSGQSVDSCAFRTRIFACEPRTSDEVIVRDEDRGLPLIVRRGHELLVAFDLSAVEAFHFPDSKRPLYTYIPYFNVQRVPETVRRPLSNVVQAMRSHQATDPVREYSTLPLTDFERVLLLVHTIANDGRPTAPLFRWPGGKRAAFVSLHDVDTWRFMRLKERSPLLRIEEKHQLKGTWFVPTCRLVRDAHAMDFLLESGHEVGWHGHNHDHRDHVGRFADVAVDALRRSWLNTQTQYPTGMRAPKLLKSQHLFTALERSCANLRYDTSFIRGVAPYHLWLSGRRSRLLEIPTTVPTDIKVYNELAAVPRSRRPDLMVKAQVARTNRLVEIGGLISIVTHPETGLSERPDFLEVFDQYLTEIRNNPDIWFTTAGEVCRYWLGHEVDTDDGVGGTASPHPIEVKAS
jgi:peptidoglycan/xylan/chitin deacetylase (PgdA/CDA1 family)